MDVEPSAVELPEKPFKDPLIRNKAIINEYTQGIPIKSIAKHFELSEQSIYKIVRLNSGIVETNREQEKARRLRRLKLCESKAPKLLAPKDATELVRVIEAQRKELEGDGESSNTTNITLNKIEINALPVNGKWDTLRGLLESD